MAFTAEGGWAEADRARATPPSAVRHHQESMLRVGLMRDVISFDEFERQIGFLLLADEWGWV